MTTSTDATLPPRSPVSPTDIEAAADVIGAHVISTPTFSVPGDEIDLPHIGRVVFKLELLQQSGSFKARGASHAIATRPISAAGVVAASGGNHGAAVAWAARRFGHDANIFVPTISAPAKVERLRSYGATVHQVGAVYAESLIEAERFEAETGASSVHAYNDPIVVAGAGTTGLEFDRQAPGLDAVLVSCGGGGLVAGVSSWYGERAQVVACETHTTTAFASALDTGQPVTVEVSGVAADALGATSIGDVPWAALQAGSVGSALVDDEAVIEAKDYLWDRFRVVVEPSAAVPLAVLRSGAWAPESDGATVGVLLCGANTALS